MASLKYPGPLCEEKEISQADLQSGKINRTFQPITNGLVIEINSYLEKIGRSSSDLFNIIVQIDSNFKDTTAKYLKNKVSRLCELKKKLTSKKKVPGVKNVKDLLNAEFRPPVSTTDRCTPQSYEADQLSTQLTETSCNLQKIIVPVNEKPTYRSVSLQTNFENDSDWDDLDKFTNLLKYKHSRLQKYSDKLEKRIKQHEDSFNDVAKRIGHYSIRNMNKRDETAKRNLHSLRDSQRQVIKQERQLKELSQKLDDAETKIRTFQTETECLREQVRVWKEKEADLQQRINNEKAKKLNVQKLNSYFKNETNTLRTKLKQCNGQEGSEQMQCISCTDSTKKLQERDIAISELNDKIEELQLEKLETKSDRKSFNENVRLCVVELSGLDVAVEKVPDVIRTVSRHLFNRKMEPSELPTSSTVQSIVDEGHFLAKTFIAKKISQAESWGLNRDGTTRYKKKILDTAVTLDSGEVKSLGFNRVAHETAVSINEVTKSHMNELSNLNSNLPGSDNRDTYIKTSLGKLAYTMSDRANNEKKASALLNEWRDEILGENSKDYEKVNSFHCMAHVLLGFHSYTCKDLKEHEQLLSSEHGPLGRDSLQCFRYWSKKKTVVERVVRTTSNVFGPCGDYHGVRDKWEAHCAAKGIKSVIGNYKDNRFNGLFQTAAEICFHRSDFIQILKQVNSPNLLLKSVLADLESDIVMTLVQSIGLFYINVTGPYWNLIVENKVPYLELYKEIAAILKFLKEIEDSPAILLQTRHWDSEDKHEISNLPYKSAIAKTLTVVNENSVCRELLLKTVTLVSKSIQRTIEKQLKDFLQDGKYSKQATEKAIQRTSFAHLSNLSCEHHFGSLDSSQRRRPHASLHHHSSVQLIKQNRKEMISWLTEMPESERNSLLKTARRGGKDLRKKHKDQESEVLSSIHSDASSRPSKKTRKKRKAEAAIENKEKRQTLCDNSESENYSDFEEEAKLLDMLPSINDIKENDYVVVAYQDAWYPGVVRKVMSPEKLNVRFMTHANKLGVFKWPIREDIQVVETRFVLLTGFVPDCVGSGRMWSVPKHEHIENLYNKYAKHYF